MGKMKINYNGQPHEATEVAVTGNQEYWNTYLLEDGTKIRSKSVVVSILRVDDAYDAAGNPVYLVKSQGIMDVNAPDSLKKKGN